MALSEREKEALRLLLVGHDAKSIAAMLNLSVYTVNDRLRDARRKLGASSSREAARRLALTEGQSTNFVGAKELGEASVAPLMAETGELPRTRTAHHRLVWFAGGMLIMSLFVAALALSNGIATPNHIQAVPQSSSLSTVRPAEADASAAARQWASLLDNGQWDTSWQGAGKIFKAQLTSQQWAATIQPVRKPLGRVLARNLQSAVQTSTLPGAPAGDYQVLQFKTHFATKPDSIETVILSREQGGWRVSGYFIR